VVQRSVARWLTLYRRTKCDGAPRCSTCQLHDVSCVYGHEHDGRRTASKQYVQALEHRVKELETQLQLSTMMGTDAETETGAEPGNARSRLNPRDLLSDYAGGSEPLSVDRDLGAEDDQDKIGALRVVFIFRSLAAVTADLCSSDRETSPITAHLLPTCIFLKKE
jgi:hypothetical protein